jgi:hypothetical protein
MGKVCKESLFTRAVLISMSPSTKSGDRFDSQRLDDPDHQIGQG